MSAKQAGTADDRQQRIEAYLSTKLDGAQGLRIVNIERPTVGWSHEIWLFDAEWTEAGRAVSRPFCVRIDPGNTLLRHMSSLETQFRVLKCLENTAVPAPEAYWYESDTDILGKPFIVMDRVPGACPNPWGSEGRRYYQEAAARDVLPASFTQALADLHNLDWRAAGLDFLGVPGTGKDFALGEVAKWKELMSLPHGQPVDPRGPSERGARLGDTVHRRPDVRRGLHAVGPQPGGHRLALQPRAAG